eukprot:4137628-Prymnesium_polylepis.1
MSSTISRAHYGSLRLITAHYGSLGLIRHVTEDHELDHLERLDGVVLKGAREDGLLAENVVVAQLQ